MSLPPRTWRIGTRASALAIAQANEVAMLLRAAFPQVAIELVPFTTRGDAAGDVPLLSLGGKGAFTQEIEAALAEGRIDLAVHSLKDLPLAMAEGVVLGAVPARQSPWDVLILREGHAGEIATVGTSSLRRRAQLRGLLPGARVIELRGNVPTRLDKLQRGDVDALVLAEAGLVRLGLRLETMRVLSLDEMVPAPGQGALGIQCREDDAATRHSLVSIEDPTTRACVDCERALLAALGGDCTLPLGAYAEPLAGGNALRLTARLPDLDGTAMRQVVEIGPVNDARGVGIAAAEALMQD